MTYKIKKYTEPNKTVDATRIEGDLVVEDLDLSHNNHIQVKKRDQK
jgi:hypothetical protein